MNTGRVGRCGRWQKRGEPLGSHRDPALGFNLSIRTYQCVVAIEPVGSTLAVWHDATLRMVALELP